MSQHSVRHPTAEAGCFQCKLGTLQFGVVPGAYRATTSMSYYDSDSLPDFPSKEEVMDNRHDYRNAPVKEVSIDSLGQQESRS